MPGVTFLLLGGAKLAAPGRSVDRMERKAAALVAYLALSGATLRTRIAGLLWPASKEKTARNNLAQVVRRTKESAGRPVIEGDATLALAADVEVDVVVAEVDLQRGRYAEAAARAGELLAGYDYDDCPDFDRWLRAQRERVTRTLRRASAAEAERLEHAGELAAAEERTASDLERDPLDESAHRRLMRVLRARGDVAGALRAFDRCKALLRDELGTAPHADTTALAAEMRTGAPPEGRGLPREEERPRPMLAGRSRELAWLEDAWSHAPAIVVTGEAGVGKSRLVADFAATKGPCARFEGREGDAGVPYATLARAYGRAVERFPIALPDWARRELARILPALGDAPLAESFEKVRLLEALTEASRLAAACGMANVVVDDLHLVDAASIEAAEYVAARLGSARAARPRLLATARTGMLPSDLDARLRRATEAGSVATLALEPLDARAVGELVLGADGALAAQAAEIHALTGGNPFYVLEVVRGFARGGAEPDLAASVRARELRDIVARRLERLSAPALRLARVAAIAGADLDLAVAADVLDIAALDLVEPLAELERAHVLTATGFTHDLLLEIVRAAVPRAVAVYVHERLARGLAVRGAEPARIAAHWLAAGRDADAAPLFRIAADRARALARTVESLELLERAAASFSAAGDRAKAFACLAEIGRRMPEMADRCGPLVARASALASTDRERATVDLLRGFAACARGDHVETDRAASLAARGAAAAGDTWSLCEAHQLRFHVAVFRARAVEAERALADFLSAGKTLAHAEADAAALWFAADLHVLSDRHEEAIAGYRACIDAVRRMSDFPVAQSRLLRAVARSQLVLGRAGDADATVREAESVFAQLPGAWLPGAELALVRAECDLALGRLDEAARGIALASRGATDAATRIGSALARASLLASAGLAADSEAAYRTIAGDASATATSRVEALLGIARTRGGLDEDDRSYAEANATPVQRAVLALRSASGDAEGAASALASVGARGRLAEAHARLAVLASASGDHTAALAHASRAEREAEAAPPVGLSMGELLAIRARVLEAARADGATAAANAARVWMDRARDAARDHLARSEK